MKLDLNTISGGSSIFNGGVAGLVEGVTIDVEKKGKDEQENYPDYKLVITDSAGNKLNQGFYYPSVNDSMSEEDNMKRINREVSRVVHVAHAVVGKDYQFPSVNGPTEAFDTLFKTIKENAGDAKFNVFTTYGSKGYPSKYLGLRYFSFIEPATGNSILKVTPSDVLERVTEDAPKEGGAKKDENWF